MSKKPPEPQKRFRIPKAKVDTGQSGRTGLRRHGGIISEDFQSELSGRTGAENMREMADSNPIVGACMNAVDFFFMQTNFPVTPAVKDDPVAEDAAEFLRGALDDMEHSWQRVLSEYLTAAKFGYSISEKVLKVRGGESRDPTRRSRYTDGRIGLRKFALRNQCTITRWIFPEDVTRARMDWDVTGVDADRPVGFEQTTLHGTFRVPLARCGHFRMREDLDNPEGRSLLRNCWMPHQMLMVLYEVEAASHNRLGLGVPIMEVPLEVLENPTSSIASTLSDELSAFQFNERSSMLTPTQEQNGVKTGYGQLRFERPQGALADINTTIVRWETRIAMNMLANWVMLGADGAGTSRAAHTDKTSMFGRGLTFLADVFTSTFNRDVVAPLMRVNGFPEASWAKLTHGAVVQPTLEEVATFFGDGVKAGILTVGPQLETAYRQAGDIAPEDQSGEDSPG